MKPQRRWPWYHSPFAEIIAGLLLPVFHGLVGYGSKVENWVVFVICYGFFLSLLGIVFRYYSSIRLSVDIKQRVIFFMIIPNILAPFAGWYWVENFEVARPLIWVIGLTLLCGLFSKLKFRNPPQGGK